jgi:hypothetical protein
MSNRKIYRYDCKSNNTTALELVRWLRSSFGCPRGQGWDFSGGRKEIVDVIIWDDKLKCMFELWKL